MCWWLWCWRMGNFESKSHRIYTRAGGCADFPVDRLSFMECASVTCAPWPRSVYKAAAFWSVPPTFSALHHHHHQTLLLTNGPYQTNRSQVYWWQGAPQTARCQVLRSQDRRCMSLAFFMFLPCVLILSSDRSWWCQEAPSLQARNCRSP